MMFDMHTDPRFRDPPPTRKTKLPIDSRFFHRITRNSFLSSSSRLDKRDKLRPKPKPTHNPMLRHYYHQHNISDDDDAATAKPIPEEEQDTTDDDSESEADKTDTDESCEEEEEVTEEIDQFIDKLTHRLAVVKQDWTRVKAVDLFKALSSFVPPNGFIKSVAVYPTEFGLQRMKEEQVHGPPLGLSTDDDDDDHNEKLRAYEMSKLRYYHAVVECDSLTTANYIYEDINGYEVFSTIPLDLRFIPDNIEFKNPPRDVATEVPANYEPLTSYSSAYQNSKVRPSSDDDEHFCAKIWKRKLNDDQIQLSKHVWGKDVMPRKIMFNKPLQYMW